ncbi:MULTISPECIES: DEAD/DEAH box helicase family protein [unclassified Leeuwenhoekiella]|uniref:restriction endonuclease n=1 Tax=unclassified Leeuwenhoekiella TaxID=2615029 RepID=UPI000C4AAC70|nr:MULTISPECIES: DEAD/DEAH box helicase family protein [unclassified Leeuwenhoekiella]MAW94301.1 DEAD/DEAH box helicase [Leeuwenhoekiella sp.]MBA82982.1 DEAD/DEAH box helicase [Leeuwenhoekiella sp.]|tara:strand:- start:6564 stop:9215 length:2652 start_codon:yes stop_codon:yes gene_type:complete
MKLSFESDLQFQQDAIQSITALFEGQPLEEAIQEFDLGEKEILNLINGVGNRLILSQEQILKNLQTVQQENAIPPSQALDGMNFSVEMETGTGKTYVYLRTIYELHALYNFKKFVIVVPSIAIREGVLKNLEITREHFQNLYDNVPVNFQVYDSGKVSALRGFATNNNIEILVINIDSFAKDQNIINQPHYKANGRKPIEFIQSTNPFVIIDEPQNMETDKRIAAIQNLNALCTLRYSATHRNQYNLTYSLNPVKAYDLGLVKQIEVDSILEENAFNDAYVAVDSITATKTKVTAKVYINVNEQGGVKKKKVTVSVGSDLYKLSKEREIYAEGYLIEEIDAANGCISLSNGSILYKGDSQGGLTDELMKFQIRKTVEEHLKKQKLLNKLGIKVLSLFFIDKVANYRNYDADGNVLLGKFAQWFEEIYKEYLAKPAFKDLNRFPVAEVHNGYFSQDKKGKLKDTSGETKADDDTYSLIMKDKEKLLNLDNPLQFIFSHSALREGWDNPNVFQICTLNETKSDIKKRQEIGRGLRLAVDQNGKRTYDQNINRLTVIANESYDDFAKTLQKEIEEECGVSFKDRIKNKRKRTPIKYRKGFDADPKFLEIWDKLKNKTTYRVDYKTDELITLAAKAVKNLPEIKAPAIRSTKVRLLMSDEGLETSYAGDKVENYDSYTWPIPDILGYIQNRTELTRSTLQEILSKSQRISDILVNPQLFLDLASQAIKRTLYDIMIDGIKYEKIGGLEYEMKLFEAQELEVYLNDFTFDVTDPLKTIYEKFIPLDSGVESKFAEDCENSDQIKFYFKLPNWFKIPTPIGNYNPDWALVFQDDAKVYFVAETKDTGTPQVDLHKLSADEQLKIKCGKAHFNEFDTIEYRVVNKVGQLI